MLKIINAGNFLKLRTLSIIQPKKDKICVRVDGPTIVILTVYMIITIIIELKYLNNKVERNPNIVH